jgi:hypothetical protein
MDSGLTQKDIGAATDFLVNLGDIAACPESPNGARELVVLDSQWLTKAFATIITMKSNFVKVRVPSLLAPQVRLATR